MHICSGTPTAASQNAGPRQQHHQCIGFPVGELQWIHAGVGDRLQICKDQSLQHLHHVRATGRKSSNAFTFGFYSTRMLIAALKQTGTVCRLRETLNMSMNTGVNSLAQCFNVDVETLSGPAAFQLLCCLNSFLTSCSCTVKRGKSGTAGSGRLTDVGVKL